VLLAELVDDLGTYLAGRPGDGVRSLADVIAHEEAHAAVELPWFGHELFVQAVAGGGRAGDAYAGARARNLEWAVTTCLEPALVGADVAGRSGLWAVVEERPGGGRARRCRLELGVHPGGHRRLADP